MVWSGLAFGDPVTLSTQLPIRASFYADKFEGRSMAGGGKFHQSKLTAASRDFPLGTTLRVSCLETGKTVTVRVTDRGPWGRRYKLDLSKAAFEALGLNLNSGWTWVTVAKASPDLQ